MDCIRPRVNNSRLTLQLLSKYVYLTYLCLVRLLELYRQLCQNDMTKCQEALMKQQCHVWCQLGKLHAVIGNDAVTLVQVCMQSCRSLERGC